MNDEKPAKPRRAQEAASSLHPNVDRLIELASDDKPAEILSPEEATDSKGKPMWKILLQLKPLLPYLARLLPLLDIGIIPAQNAGLSNEVRQAIAKIQTIQRDVDIAVQDQVVQLKRLEQELARLRDASETYAQAQEKLGQEVQSIAKLVRIAGIGLAILLLVLVVMTGMLLIRAPQ